MPFSLLRVKVLGFSWDTEKGGVSLMLDGERKFEVSAEGWGPRQSGESEQGSFSSSHYSLHLGCIILCGGGQFWALYPWPLPAGSQ